MQMVGTNKCPYYYTEGIGNNLILNKLTFTGKNTMGLDQLFVLGRPLNITIINTEFLEAQWNSDSMGIVSGYPEDIPLC